MRQFAAAHGMRRALCKGSGLAHSHHLKEDLVIKPLAFAISVAGALLVLLIGKAILAKRKAAGGGTTAAH